MTSKVSIDNFLAQSKIAVLGVSRSKSKFGNRVFKNLLSKGYRLFPVHPQLEKLDDVKCFPSLSSIPEKVDAAFICLSPDQTENVIEEISEVGIKYVWMQQGAASAKAIQYCKQHGINVIHDECILMFAEPVGFGHRLHRGIWKLLGKYPDT